VLLFDGLTSPERLEERARAVVDSLTRPLRLEGATVTLGVNVGGATYPGHGETEAALLAAADRAMYAAKQAGEPYRMAG
jgi:predicted signal transduction protein with EAL and GGDEF domain